MGKGLKRGLAGLALFLAACGVAWATATVSFSYNLSINDGAGNQIGAVQVVPAFNSGLLEGERVPVSLTGSSFTALSPPSGATGVCIPNIPASCTLKGVTGDTGIVMTGASPKNVPLIVPLGSSPSIGITNGGSTVTVDVIYF